MKRRMLSLLLALAMAFNLLPGTAFAQGEDNAKLIAFTFDDGPSRYTAQLLDGLREREVTATFFMTGVNGRSGITNYKSLLTRMRDEGHQLANHTYSHATLSALPAGQVVSEVSQVESLLFEAMGGSYIDMVRTPGGLLNTTVRNNVQAPIILWSVDPLDWECKDEDKVYQSVLDGAQDGSIVLMHDLYLTSVQAALRAVDTLKEQGYEFVTVAELMRRRGITLSNGCSYASATGNTLPPYSPPEVTVAPEPGESCRRVTAQVENELPLYYTTDGTLPNLGSPRYTEPLKLDSDMTLTFVGIDAYGTRTPVTVQTVTIPILSPPQVGYENGVLTLTGEEGADVYFTVDGSLPTRDSIRYTGPFTNSYAMIRCVAIEDGCQPSQVVTCTWTRRGGLVLDMEGKS